MSIGKNITEIIGSVARYLLILFILFLFLRIFFPSTIQGLDSELDRYIDVNLFLIIVIVFLILAILLEKKFMPERYKEYAEGGIEDNGNAKDAAEVKEEKISLTKKGIVYIAIMSILGMILTYYALSLHYKLLPFYLLLLLSGTAGLLIAFLSFETMKEDKKNKDKIIR